MSDKKLIAMVREERSVMSDRFHVVNVSISAEDSDGKWRYPFDRDATICGLGLRCQASSNNAEHYAWTLHCTEHQPDVTTMRAMVKVIDAVDRKLEKIKVEAGACATFAQYALRVLTALGVSGFRVYVSRSSFDNRDDSARPMHEFDYAMRRVLASGKAYVQNEPEQEAA